MKSLVRFMIVGTMVFAGLCVPRQATAYSVLAHEANIDALWDTTIKTIESFIQQQGALPSIAGRVTSPPVASAQHRFGCRRGDGEGRILTR